MRLWCFRCCDHVASADFLLFRHHWAAIPASTYGCTQSLCLLSTGCGSTGWPFVDRLFPWVFVTPFNTISRCGLVRIGVVLRGVARYDSVRPWSSIQRVRNSGPNTVNGERQKNTSMGVHRNSSPESFSEHVWCAQGWCGLSHAFHGQRSRQGARGRPSARRPPPRLWLTLWAGVGSRASAEQGSIGRRWARRRRPRSLPSFAGGRCL